MKIILYLMISLLLIMCYIERQQAREAAAHPGITGIKPDRKSPGPKKMPPALHQFTL